MKNSKTTSWIIKRHVPLILLGLIFFSSTTRAQNDLTPSRVGEQIGRTDQILSNAARVVMETESAKARLVLENAVKIQEKARETFLAGRNPINTTMLGFALKLTIEAREQAIRAHTIAKEDLDRENRTLEAIDRARMMLERTEARARDEGLSPVMENRIFGLLEEARKQIENAQAQLREHQYKIAYGLAQSAQRLCEQAMAAMRNDDASLDDVRREVERTERLLDQARDMARNTDNPRVFALIDKARELQDRAEDQFLAGQFRNALRLTQEARQFIRRAFSMAGEVGGPERVERNLALTDQLIQRAGGVIRGSSNAQAETIFEQGVVMQENARRLFESGDLKAALDRTLDARSLVRRALTMVEGSVGAAEVEKVIERTAAFLQRVLPEAQASGNEDLLHMLDRARGRLEEARRLLSQGEEEEAMNRARLARRLIQRAQDILQDRG